MADFVAILKKTIDAQGVTTADMRARVYNRARQTIEQKLAALTPPPTADQKTRQLKALDDAIDTVEKSYQSAGAPAAKQIDPLEAFIKAQEASNQSGSARAQPPTPLPASAPPFAIKPYAAPTPYAPSPPKIEPVLPSAPMLAGDSAKSSRGTLVWLLTGFVAAAAAGYGGYLKRDEITAYYQNLTAPSVPDIKKVTTTTIKPDDKSPKGAVSTEASAPEAAAPAKPDEASDKFTQRLTVDGKETDTGPSQDAAAVGEGASVSQVTKPADPAATAGETAAPADPNAVAPADPGVAAPADPNAAAAAADPAAPAAIAVGQKVVFYEEKTGTAEGTVKEGAAVWSVVQDSPSADQPKEPAIRAEVTVPDNGIKLTMTIKRNRDATLPASHIIEMVFTVPEGFTGGSIDGVQRVTFKDSEQAPGSPLVGVPANFGDGFFLIALTDEKSAVEANLALMGRQSWIDIPLTYKSGRRALISIEKGIPGDKAFQEVMKSWQEKASG